MASAYTVCIMQDQENLNKLIELLKDYDYWSEEIQSLLNGCDEDEWLMPTAVYADTIKLTNRAIWFIGGRICGNAFFDWIASKTEKKMLYAYYNDCGNDVYYVEAINGEHRECLGSVDIFKFYEEPNETELLEQEFISISVSCN